MSATPALQVQRITRPRLIGRNHRLQPEGNPRVLAKTLGEGALWSGEDPYGQYEREFLEPLKQAEVFCIESIQERWRNRKRFPDQFWGQLFIHAVEAARLSGLDVFADDKVTAVYQEAVECEECARNSKACETPWGYSLEGLRALGFVEDLDFQIRRGLQGKELEAWLAQQLQGLAGPTTGSVI